MPGLIVSSQEAERGTLVPSSLSFYTVEDPTLWLVPHTFRVGLLSWTKPLCKHTQGRTCSEWYLLGDSEPRQWTFKVNYRCLQNRLSREFPLLGWSPRMKLYKFTQDFEGLGYDFWVWTLSLSCWNEEKKQKGKSKALLSLQAIIFKNIFDRLSAPQLIVHHPEPSSWRFSSHKYSCSQLTTHKTKVPKTYRQPRVTHCHHCGAESRVWRSSAGAWWMFVTWRLWILFCLLLSMTSHFPVLLPRSPGTAR